MLCHDSAFEEGAKPLQLVRQTENNNGERGAGGGVAECNISGKYFAEFVGKG